MPMHCKMACYLKLIHEYLGVTIGTYVNDSIGTEIKRVSDNSTITEPMFELVRRKYGPILFAGVGIHQINGQ